MKERRLLDIGLNIILIGLGLWIIYMLFLKITGRSPTIEEITLTVVTAMAVELFRMNASLNKLEGRFSEHSRKFDSLASDFKAHISKKHH